MPLRFSIKWLLATTVYVAIAAAAFKEGWWIWADLLWGVAWLALGYALLNVWLREGAARAGAAGFVILMVCYGLSVQFAPGSLPTERILKAAGIDDLVRIPPPPTISYPTMSDVPDDGLSMIPSPDVFMARDFGMWEPKLRAAHSVGAMLVGLTGYWLGLLAWRQNEKKGPTTIVATLVGLAIFIASGAAYGQEGPITYVDATHGAGGNTKLASGEDFAPRVDLSVGNDGKWSLRIFGNGGSVYTANDGRPAGPEDAPQLVTTLTGLTPGERYGVFVYFWTDHHNWQIVASLEPPATSGEQVAGFTRPGDRTAAEATPDMFDSEVMVEESNRQLMQASLGKVAANDQGEIKVWIDDVPGSTSATRTWYDGVGYVEEPEPPQVEMGSLLDWWPWIVMLAVGFVVYIMIAARRRGRASMIDDGTAT